MKKHVKLTVITYIYHWRGIPELKRQQLNRSLGLLRRLKYFLTFKAQQTAITLDIRSQTVRNIHHVQVKSKQIIYDLNTPCVNELIQSRFQKFHKLSILPNPTAKDLSSLSHSGILQVALRWHIYMEKPIFSSNIQQQTTFLRSFWTYGEEVGALAIQVSKS